MSQLFRHIEFLLIHHDCVIVPGLGAFIATALPARIDRMSKKIFPPCRYVMFNQAVTLDDGLLANSYARSLSLTFEEARQLITKEVASVMEILRSQTVLSFGRLGTLTLGEENRLIFSPVAKPEDVSLSIGFSVVDFSGKSLDVCSSPTREEQNNINKNVSVFKRGNKRLIKFTAVFSLFIFLTLSFFIFPHRQEAQEHRASVVPVEALLPASSASVKESVPPTDNSVDPVKKECDYEFEKDVKQPEHYLIVATFHSRKEADRYVDTYTTPEFPLVAVPSRKLTRVSVASSDNKEELFKKLNSSEISHRFPNAWVWSSSK